MSQYFPKPFEPFRGGISVKINSLIIQQKLIQKMQQELIHVN